MRGITVFRSTLFLPVIIPPLAVYLGLSAGGFLGVATFVILAPYVIFAMYIWRRLEKCNSYKDAYILIAKAPIIFSLPVAIIWSLGLILTGIEFSKALSSAAGVLLVMLSTAYLYSALAAFFAFSMKALGASDRYQ
ncbi:MAG: hypothetical protein JKY26_01095 [Pseudomonas sp.]|nr:hypothetical protein [Pseudomonas sp.]